LRSHLLNLLVYATLVSAYFGILVRRRSADQLRLASIIWAAMVGGAVVLAFLMYPFPR
jgi:amino acid permease